MDKNQTLKIKVIIGSTREGRFSEYPAKWIASLAKKRQELDVEIVDLRDYKLPFFNEAVSPSYSQKPYDNKEVSRWSQKISEADGFIIISPEYNHSFTAVLKNALDYIYYPWNNKAVGYVSYGSVSGARSIEQLRLVAIELQLANVRQSINIPGDIYLKVLNSKGSDLTPFETINDRADIMLDQLALWSKYLKMAREQTK